MLCLGRPHAYNDDLTAASFLETDSFLKGVTIEGIDNARYSLADKCIGVRVYLDLGCAGHLLYTDD
jgi:hypothetical protein